MRNLLKSVLAAMVVVGGLASCDEDERLAMNLEGEWEGDFYSCYYYYYKSEVEPRVAYADKTYMKFIPDHLFGSTRGEGYEIDFYNDGPIEYTEYEFDWRITDGVLYLEYFDAPDMNVEIYNYRLSNGHFRGYFGENRSSFDMTSLDGCQWDDYEGPYHKRDVDYSYRFDDCRRTR